MKGWKTWTGAGIVFVSGGMMAFAGLDPRYAWLQGPAQALLSAGAALGLVGIGHKVDRQGR